MFPAELRQGLVQFPRPVPDALLGFFPLPANPPRVQAEEQDHQEPDGHGDSGAKPGGLVKAGLDFEGDGIPGLVPHPVVVAGGDPERIVRATGSCSRLPGGLPRRSSPGRSLRAGSGSGPARERGGSGRYTGKQHLADLLLQLADRLRFTASGKKQYGYLKAPLKSLVDEIVDELEKAGSERSVCVLV